MKTLTLILLSAFFIPSSFALDLKSARDKGLVGETLDGHVASIKANPSAEVTQLISQINAKRTAHYKKIAAKNKADVMSVQSSVHKKIMEKLKPGHFYKDAKGAWAKK